MAKGKRNKVKAAPVKRSKSGVEPAASNRAKHDKAAAPVVNAEIQATQASANDTKVMGFTNLGNTCFFNSVLQVLVASPPLQQFFAQPNVKLHQGPLGGALQEVFDQVQLDHEQAPGDKKGASDKPSKAKKQKQKGSYAPQRLLSAVCKVAPHFKGFQQQDSHELLRVLLDGLQTEEAKAIAARLKHLPQQAEEEEGEADHAAAPASKPQGFLSEVFGGQLSSQVACEACDYTSVTLEPFMDLSLPIPSGAVADSESGPERKGQKGHQGKKSVKGELEAAAHDDDRKLTAKQKKKLLKEERKAVKLERKRQPKASPAATANTATASDSQTDSAADSSSIPGNEPLSQSTPNAAPAAVTEAVKEAVTDAVEEAVQEAVAGTAASVEPHSVTAHASDELGRSSHGAEGDQQQCIVLNGELSPQQPDANSSRTAHAEPAQQHDMLREFESMSGKLPDMPQQEPQDDLAGLFQKAFHTCCSEMSPRGTSGASTFSPQEQNGKEEDLSLYEDADALSQNDGVTLDASDEEEGKYDETAEPMLKTFIGDAGMATESSNGISHQAAEDNDDCTNIGSLFDEDSAAADAPAPATADFGADESDAISDEKAEASEGATLQGCLQGFFQQETITWECPAEKQARRDLRRTSLGTDKPLPATPTGKEVGEATPDARARRTVSFSEAEPVVTLIPGSVEQRGQVFRTSHGDPPFCRPLRVGGAFLLLSCAPDQRRASRMHIHIQPQDDEEATLKLASNVRHLATADVPAPKVGDDEEEVRLAQAQVLMDCTADLMSQKGLGGTRAWCQGGLKLRLKKNAEGTNTWIVFGQLPQDEGQGRWEYPSPTDPSQPPTDGEVDFQPPGTPRRASSSSSDSSASSPSSAADASDNSQLHSLMSSVSGNLHLDDNFSQPSSSSNAEAHEPVRDTNAAGSDDSATAVDTADSRASAASTAEAAQEAPGRHSSEDAATAVGGPASSASTTVAGHGLHSPASAADQPDSISASESADATNADLNGKTHEDKSQAAAAGVDPTASQTATSAVAVISEAVEAAIEEVAAEAAGPAGNDALIEGNGSESGHNPYQSEESSSSSQTHCGEPHVEAVNGDSTNGFASDVEGTDGSSSSTAEGTPLDNRRASVDGAGQPHQKQSAKKGGLVNVQRSAVKGYSIHKCPPLLTVHVKRFQQDLRGRLSKIDGAVSFPLNLDLTPFCDSKGHQTGSARYTLLGLVEHMGTMRSGHYVAYVQRGLTVSESPQLQALLQKHGILDASDATSPPPAEEPVLAGKGTKKGKASKAASSAASKSGEGKDAKTNGLTSRTPDALQTTSGALVQKGREPDAQAQPDSSRSRSAASSVAAEGSHDDAAQEAGKGASSVTATRFQPHDGVPASQHSIPDDWENSDSSATEDSQAATAAVNAVQQTNGVHRNATHSTGSSGQNDTVLGIGSPHGNTESSDSSRNQTESMGLPLTQGSDAKQKVEANGAGNNELQEKRAWYYISDTQVKPVTEADVLSREAYVLLYMRAA